MHPLDEEKSTRPLVCDICGAEYWGHGHNAQPVTDRQCCDACNVEVVIPARLRALGERERE
jgi:hypothetical protein